MPRFSIHRYVCSPLPDGKYAGSSSTTNVSAEGVNLIDGVSFSTPTTTSDRASRGTSRRTLLSGAISRTARHSAVASCDRGVVAEAEVEPGREEARVLGAHALELADGLGAVAHLAQRRARRRVRMSTNVGHSDNAR